MAAPPLHPLTGVTLQDPARPGKLERSAARVVRASSRSEGAQAVVLADFLTREPAERLALRLVAEAVAAEVWPPDEASVLMAAGSPMLLGPTVVVRSHDHATAMALAQLFAEIDAGTSMVAPPPRDFWHGPADRRLLGVGALVLLAVALGILLVAAALA